MPTKQELRQLIKQAKKSVSPAQMQAEAQVVFERIELMPAFSLARNILLYYSLPDELPTHEVVERWAKTKRIFLPRVEDDHLAILPYRHNLSTNNPYGIGEPIGNDSFSPEEIDLVIVPAVALDQQGHRLGRGKGYYDRLLPRCTRATTIGVALQCQLVPHVPTSTHDISLHTVVTAKSRPNG